MKDKPHAIVIGAGFTGCAIAHDLALRGFQATVLERGEIASGTSGRTHGLLHSGGRYCVKDKESAVECIQENILLRKIAKQCIEFNGGYFVALNERDLEYAPLFEQGAQECGIEIENVPVKELLRIEPHYSPRILAAYSAPDGAFDPLRLALAFAASARKNGAAFRTFHQVEELLLNGTGDVVGVKVMDRTTNKIYELRGDIVINATGAWAGQITSMARASVSVTPTPGVMVAYDQRLINHVINRLAPAGDGDIIIPQRRMMCIGTTSFEVTDVDYIPVYQDQVDAMQQCAVELIPDIAKTNKRGIWMSARPLVGSSAGGRSMARTFKCFDHKEVDNIDGMVTITGGKATTCRAMAETTVDVVCQKLAVNAVCTTKEVVLDSYRAYYRREQ